MFESVRSHRRWLMFFLLVLVIPSFVVTGIYGYSQFVGGDNAVARVDGQPVTQAELDAAHREQIERLRAMFGERFDARMFDTPQARAATLDNLLAERALARQAQAEHVQVDERRLREIIAAEQAFQVDGKFNYERYRQLLAAQGLTEVGFEQRVRSDLARQTLLQAVADSAIVPRAVAQQVRRLAEEQREVRELRFEPKDFLARVAVTDAQIKAFYDANQNDFKTTESIRVEYVVLTLDDVTDRVPAVTEADARAFYEQNPGKFGQDEQRRASHILLTAGEGGSAGDKAAARKLAEQLLARIRATPAEFDKLAREHSKDPGSAAGGGDLGWFGRGMMVKPFEDAAFALKEGQISDIVESDFGLHLIRVTGVRGAQPRPFEEVRAQILTDLKRDAAAKRFAETAEQFSNAVFEQPDSFKAVADKLKLDVRSIDAVTRAGVPARPDAQQIFTPRLIEALFSLDSIESKRNTEAIEVAANTLVSARVIEHRPSMVRPLADVTALIKTRVELAEAGRLARAAGEQKIAALKREASEAGFGPVRSISRMRPEGLSPPALGAIMRAPADKLPAFVGAELDGGAFAVFSVLSVKVPEKADAAQAQAQASALAQVFGASDAATYVADIRAEHRAQVLSVELKSAASAQGAGEAKGEGR